MFGCFDPQTDGDDYSSIDVMVQFDVGPTPMTRKVTIPILEDSVLEKAERFLVSLEVTNRTTRGVKLGTPPTATVEIADNDGECWYIAPCKDVYTDVQCYVSIYAHRYIRTCGCVYIQLYSIGTQRDNQPP